MAFNLLLLWYGYTSRIIQLYESDVLEKFFFYRPLRILEKVRDAIERKRSAYSSANEVNRLISSAMLLPLRMVLQAIISIWIIVDVISTSTTQMLCFNVFWLIYSSYSLFIDRKISSDQMEGSENEWGFGQVVPLLLLSSTVMLFKELYTDQKVKGEAQALDSSINNSLTSLRHSLSTERTLSDDGSQHVTIGAVEPNFTFPRRSDTEAGGREGAIGISRRSTARALSGRTSQ